MAGVPAPEINYEFAGLMITFQARIGEKVGETGKISPETREKTSKGLAGRTLVYKFTWSLN